MRAAPKTWGVTVIFARTKGDQNRAVLDPWSAVHFGVGLAAGLVALPIGWAFVPAVLYEIIEGEAELDPNVRSFFKVSQPETLENQAADLAVFAIGYVVGQRWNKN